MEQISDTDLFLMMDIVSSSPELRERVERRIQSNRKSKKAYNAKAYAEKKDKAKMEKEEANKPKRSGESAYIRALERKIEAERKAKK